MRTPIAFLLTVIFCHAAYAEELFGTVEALSGNASVADITGTTASIHKGQQIFQGQTLSTSPDSEVHIATVDGGFIALRENTVFRVDEYQASGDDSADKIFMSLLKGAMRSITGWIGTHNKSAYRITTPSATIGIRGTDHETMVILDEGGDEPGTYDTVSEGATLLRTPQGETEVRPGKFAFAPRNRLAPPHYLASHPGFWAMRKLRIEQRIQQRKMFLRRHRDQMRIDMRRKRLKQRQQNFHDRPMQRRDLPRRDGPVRPGINR